MDTKELQYFAAVYQEKSINKAAKTLYMTAPGLSRILTRLENELGAALFIRTQKGVEPTESADYLYGRMHTLLEYLAETENGLNQLSRKQNGLRVACANGVLNALSIQLILDFVTNNPQIDFEWGEYSNTQVRRRVALSQADVGLVVGHAQHVPLRGRKLTDRQVVLLVYRGHPFFERGQVDIGDLRDENVLLLNEAYQINHEFKAKCAENGFRPCIVAETGDSHFLYKLCRQRMGLGVLIDFSTDYFLMPDIRAIPFRKPFLWEIFEVLTEQAAEFPNVRIFQRHLDAFLGP